MLPESTNLPFEAREASVVPELKESLISVGKVCDADCIVTFDKNKVTATKNGKIIIEGERNKSNKLYYFNLEGKK